MSKRRNRLLFMAVLAVLATALWVGSSNAVITGTAHSTGVGTAGPCSACHIPHGGGADRLWPSTPGGGTYTGAVAPLCSSCHSATGGYSASMGAAASDGFVYHAQSHGTLMSVTNVPWSTAVGSSGLPYAAQANNFECTSCHEVHDDTQRPFLRDSLEALCARCHTNRHYVGGALSEGGTVTPGAWGGTTYTGTANPGSHPVGTDITGELDTGSPDSVVTIPTALNIVRSATVGGWVLGPKTTATGVGVTCVTCHAVHGAQDDADNTGGNTPAADVGPYVNYLAIEQNSVSAAWTNNRSVANGDTQFNALCEGCHGVANNPANDPDGAFTSTYNVNPGASGTFSHPIDEYASSIDAGVSAFGTNWPVGGGMTAGGNVAPIPICESCHMPHPTADSTRTDAGTSPGEYILRDAAATVCDTCHTATPTDHHPVGVTYNSSGVGYLTNTTGASGDTLGCTSCHSGAHNWAAMSEVALDSAWLPANNGRTGTQSTEMYNANMSITCMDCHYAMDGDAASVSPTLGTNATVTLEAEFQTLDTSMGTHYIGLIHNPGAANNWEGDGTTDSNGNTWTVPRVDIFSTTTNWVDDLTGTAPGYSRFGGTSTTPVLVCESCHELEPDKNGGFAHLLLAPYGEAADADTDGGLIGNRDALCEACHGVPNGTHQVSGMIVSRTGLALNTTSGWVSGPRGDATFGTNAVSCDSCHQPHDANDNSYTFILDSPDQFAFTSGTVTMVGAGTVDTGTPEESGNYTSGTYATPTLSGRGGSFTNFCDSCHEKANTP